MKYLLFLLLFVSSFVNAEIKTNANGKTLNQFFVMASDILKKPIIVDEQIKQNIIIYGDANVSNFKAFFHSVLNSYNLSAFDDGTLIKISAGGKTNKTNIESVESFVTKVTQDVFIDGSVGYTRDNKRRFFYSFSYSTGEIFDPYSVGMKIESITNCMAHLSFNNYKTLITCNPKTNNSGEPDLVVDDTDVVVDDVDVVDNVVGEVIGI